MFMLPSAASCMKRSNACAGVFRTLAFVTVRKQSTRTGGRPHLVVAWH